MVRAFSERKNQYILYYSTVYILTHNFYFVLDGCVVVFEIFVNSSVAEPDPGSGDRCLFDPGFRIRNRFFSDPGPDPKPLFLMAK